MLAYAQKLNISAIYDVFRKFRIAACKSRETALYCEHRQKKRRPGGGNHSDAGQVLMGRASLQHVTIISPSRAKVNGENTRNIVKRISHAGLSGEHLQTPFLC